MTEVVSGDKEPTLVLVQILLEYTVLFFLLGFIRNIGCMADSIGLARSFYP
jgi:hypothetical protein